MFDGLRSVEDGPDTAELQAARELRQARVRVARDREDWREVGEVKRIGPSVYQAQDGRRLRPFGGSVFEHGQRVPMLYLPPLAFVVGPNNQLGFYEVTREP